MVRQRDFPTSPFEPAGRRSYCRLVSRIVVASDAPWVRAEIRGALGTPDAEVIELERGSDVRDVVDQSEPDVVILDFQIGNMGAAAICRDLREEEAAGRLPHVAVVFLLDRAADVFLARRNDADAWLMKPVSSSALYRTLDILLAGGTWTPEAAGVVPQIEAEIERTSVEESETAAFQASPTSAPD